MADLITAICTVYFTLLLPLPRTTIKEIHM